MLRVFSSCTENLTCFEESALLSDRTHEPTAAPCLKTNDAPPLTVVASLTQPNSMMHSRFGSNGGVVPSSVNPQLVATDSAYVTTGPVAFSNETCRFPKLQECAHFHYERVELCPLKITLQESSASGKILHTQQPHKLADREFHYDDECFTVQVTSNDECWLLQRSLENFIKLDSQLHQCIYDRKVSQLPDLFKIVRASGHFSYHSLPRPTQASHFRARQRNDSTSSASSASAVSTGSTTDEKHKETERVLKKYVQRFSAILDDSVNCGPVLTWFQLDNRGHRLLVPNEECDSINTPAVAAAYSIKKYVSQARDELNLEVGDMISVIDMASPGESIWWRGKRGFQVGFFPQHCVQIIGEKMSGIPQTANALTASTATPIKPVLRKHGKLIAFFRSFILNRPSRRRLKQCGILKERVFGCDLGEHLLNSGHEIPMVLKCCAEFIENHGLVDGIYRLSGVTSNIQRLRNAFDEDRIPDLYTEDILQDIHSVASLLKMYFRELPNPLCTYQLYHSFVNAIQASFHEGSVNGNGHCERLDDDERLARMRETVHKLPPPHYRTLEYLMKHLARVAKHGARTGMTSRNVAIVWAPNLLRCAELETGSVAALQGVGVQAVVTEYLICYTDLIFNDNIPMEISTNDDDNNEDGAINGDSPSRVGKLRPKSLQISTPTKLLTLEEARNRQLLNKADDSNNYIEVGGGPKNLPEKYHTVIELPQGFRKRSLSKRSPLGWKSFFTKSRNTSQGNLTKASRMNSTPGVTTSFQEKPGLETELSEIRRKLRPVKSAESLTSAQSDQQMLGDVDTLGPLNSLSKPPGHNRSVSHDSYFDHLQTSNNNSEGSLLDLSDIQLNFELEESEMRIFSEDESLVSSPRINKDMMVKKPHHQRQLSSTTFVPSPKKQARIVPLSPESQSRKRTRLEDQLSDILYIDCNTPDMSQSGTIQAIIHTNVSTCSNFSNNTDSSKIIAKTDNHADETEPPRHKSPRNTTNSNEKPSSNDRKHKSNNRNSLNLDLMTSPSYRAVLPKSLTEIDLQTPTNDSHDATQPTCFQAHVSGRSSANLTPQTPINYKLLSDSDTEGNRLHLDLTPNQISPDFSLTEESTAADISYKKLRDSQNCNAVLASNTCDNVDEIPLATTPNAYENIRTTINITYQLRSPVKTKFDDDHIYDDVSGTDNAPDVLIPTHEGNLPVSEASQNVYKTRVTNIDELLARQEMEKIDSIDNIDAAYENVTSHADETAIYEQVKYFRRSIHEINELLEKPFSIAPEENKENITNTEPFDSLEINDGFGKTDKSKVKQLTTKFEKQTVERQLSTNSGAKIATSNISSNDEDAVILRNSTTTTTNSRNTYPTNAGNCDALPACVRARNAKFAKSGLKTQSLDEHAFHKQFGGFVDGPTTAPVAEEGVSGVLPSGIEDQTLGKSLDERLNRCGAQPKQLHQPKSLPDQTKQLFDDIMLNKLDANKLSSTNDDVTDVTKTELNCDQLNRDRIEKYKEERRNFLREKYNTESFRGEKDVIVNRLKEKINSKKERDDEDGDNQTPAENITVDIAKRIHIFNKPNQEVEIKPCEVLEKKWTSSLQRNCDTNASSDGLKGLNVPECRLSRDKNCDSFMRGKDDGNSRIQSARHTFDGLNNRERCDVDEKRVSLDSKIGHLARRNDKPSYCIKDMTAMFESKSNQS